MFARYRYVKVVIWMVALLGVWGLGRSFAATDTLLLFAAAGVVPGTNTVLAPNQVLWLLGGLLALAVLLIFGSNLRRALQLWFGRGAFKGGPEEMSKPAVVIRLPKQPGLLAQTARRIRSVLASIFAAVAGSTRRHFPRVVAAATRRWQHIQQAVHATWQRRWPQARHAQRALRAAIVSLVTVVIRYAVHFWRWLEPYLRAFDRWLGVQYHRRLAALCKSEKVKTATRLIRETSKVIANWRTEVRVVLSRVTSK